MPPVFARLVCVVLVCAFGAARADTVALLPLDAEARLEIYGQPVASEIARALRAADLEVVVVDEKMVVPERALLIVDGTIKAGKGDAVLLTLRVRNPIDGKVLDTFTSTAPTIANIDRAAAELSSRSLPVVRDWIAKLTAPQPDLTPQPPLATPARPAPKTFLVAVSSQAASAATLEPFRATLDSAAAAWLRDHAREPKIVNPTTLAPTLAARTVATSGAERAIYFEVLQFAIKPGMVPVGRTRVRVRIADAGDVVFDRVVVTDTVVGDRNMRDDVLAARIAREVLDILRPHMRRTVGAWR